MGTFFWPLEVQGLNGGLSESVRALVDTGASYTQLPGSMLRRLGIDPTQRIEFDLADGRVVEEEIGEAS